MFQRVTAISILVILLLGMASYYPVFKFDQWQIHKAISRQLEKLIPENELEVISVAQNSNEIQWIRKDREFRYKGHLYDVVRSKKTGSVIRYYCINDGEETELVKQYEKTFQSQAADNRAPSKSITIQVLKIFFSLIYSPGKDITLGIQPIFLQHDGTWSWLYAAASGSIDSPPPKPLV